jgi:hypothetical protein
MWTFLGCSSPAVVIVEDKEHRELPRDTAAKLEGRLRALGVDAPTESVGRTLVVHTDAAIPSEWLAGGGLSVLAVDEDRSHRLRGVTPAEMRANDPDLDIRRIVPDGGGWVVLAEPVISPEEVASATATSDGVDVRLTPSGTEKLAVETTRIADGSHRLALLVGPAVVSTPVVQTPLHSGELRVFTSEAQVVAAQIAWPLPSGLVVREQATSR